MSWLADGADGGVVASVDAVIVVPGAGGAAVWARAVRVLQGGAPSKAGRKLHAQVSGRFRGDVGVAVGYFFAREEGWVWLGEEVEDNVRARPGVRVAEGVEARWAYVLRAEGLEVCFRGRGGEWVRGRWVVPWGAAVQGWEQLDGRAGR